MLQRDIARYRERPVTDHPVFFDRDIVDALVILDQEHAILYRLCVHESLSDLRSKVASLQRYYCNIDGREFAGIYHLSILIVIDPSVGNEVELSS